MPTTNFIEYTFMRQFLYFLTIFVFISCSHTTPQTNHQQKELNSPFKDLPEIRAIKTCFPLYLSRIDYDKSDKVDVSTIVKNKIQQTILDFYFIECRGDSSESYFKIKDVYFNSIELADKDLIYYLVILSQRPGESIDSKIICYNTTTNSFFPKIIDFNIGFLYNIENGKLMSSNLKTLFKLDGPEIELVDFNRNGMNELKLARLYHNGTANATETSVLQLKNAVLDTLDFKQKWIGPESEIKK
jgi:hypothetical protein